TIFDAKQTIGGATVAMILGNESRTPSGFLRALISGVRDNAVNAHIEHGMAHKKAAEAAEGGAAAQTHPEQPAVQHPEQHAAQQPVPHGLEMSSPSVTHPAAPNTSAYDGHAIAKGAHEVTFMPGDGSFVFMAGGMMHRVQVIMG